MSAVILLIVSLLIYFIPTFIARSRRHHNYGAIVALNIFLGWTFIGWVASLVWALTATKTAGGIA